MRHAGERQRPAEVALGVPPIRFPAGRLRHGPSDQRCLAHRAIPPAPQSRRRQRIVIRKERARGSLTAASTPASPGRSPNNSLRWACLVRRSGIGRILRPYPVRAGETRPQGGARATPPRAVRRPRADPRRRARRRPVRPRAPSPSRARTCLRACARGCPWVLDQVPTLGCATVQGQAVCLWPGQLRLDLGASGGTLRPRPRRPTARSTCASPAARSTGRRTSASTAPPPPSSTRTARRACASRAGRHRLAGRFAWSRLPESLSVPAGDRPRGPAPRRPGACPRPRRDEAGLLWLRAGAETARRGREPAAPGLPPDPRRHPALRRDAPRARGGGPRAGGHAPGSAPAGHACPWPSRATCRRASRRTRCACRCAAAATP